MRLKKQLKNIFALFCSLAFCLLAGELLVMAFYRNFYDYNMEMWRYSKELKMRLPFRDLPFAHCPGKEGDYYGAHIKINSFGARDYEYALEKQSDKIRIIFLGDSFTMGWGVPFEKTYTKRLERLLNQQGKRFEVINMGVGNYNSTMETELFKLNGLGLNPDMVVLMYFVNDVEPVPRQMSLPEYWLRKNSYLFAFLFDRYAQLMPRLSKSLNWWGYYSDLYFANPRGLQANRGSLTELFKLCKEKNIRLLVVNIPWLRELKNYPLGFATEYIRGLAAEYGVAFLDLLPVLANHEPSSLWVSAEDLHANAQANALIAQEIYRKIIRDGLWKG
jgi:lysophospholipase L1-like esterase